MTNFRDRVVELRRIRARDLAPNPKNWREHPRAQREALTGVLEEIGFADVNLAFINEAGLPELIDGHLRQELSDGDQEIPTIILDLTREEADRVLLTHDFITGMAESNRAAVKRLLAGQDEGEIHKLLERIRREAGIAAANQRDPDALPPESPEPRTQPGELWQLGRHRLMVGDSTLEAPIHRLMGNERASLIFTDPPYGVAYAADNFEAIRNDALQRGALVTFLTKALQNAVEFAKPAAAFYVWHASATREEYSQALRAAGLVELQYLIWVKPSLVLGRADYQWQHEPCFYACREGERPIWQGGRSESTVWHVASPAPPSDIQTSLGRGVVLQAGEAEIYVTDRIPKSTRLRTIAIDQGAAAILAGAGGPETDTWQFARDVAKAQHPTQKPVALAQRAIENSTREGALVLDSFVGSGTTLVAAEITGRKCYALDLEPGYADVTIRRWELLTGGKAVRID